MTLIAQAIDDSLAGAIYELLLQTPLHVPLRDGRPFAIQGPGGQLAVPVFLDRPALERWGGSAMQSAVHSAPDAARIALALPDAWLVVDLGSVPGNQPIARAGVEALARGAYPGQDRTAHARGVIANLSHAATTNTLTPDLLRTHADLRVFTIGSSVPAADDDPTSAVMKIGSVNVLSVKTRDGAQYLPAWPTAGPMFRFLPDLPRALNLEFGRLIEYALELDLGIVVDPQGSSIVDLPAPRLAALWRGA